MKGAIIAIFVVFLVCCVVTVSNMFEHFKMFKVAFSLFIRAFRVSCFIQHISCRGLSAVAKKASFTIMYFLNQYREQIFKPE